MAATLGTLIFDHGALGRGPAIGPENGGPCRVAIGVQQHQAVHLSGDRQRHMIMQAGTHAV